MSTASARGDEPRVLRGHVVSFAEPDDAGPRGPIREYRRGAVAIDGEGRIAWRGHHSRLPRAFTGARCDDHGQALILPGFIDAHVHFPQHRMLAAPGRDLLDWLDRFAFPEEERYRDPDYASAAAEVFLDRLLAHGTTAALVFSTVHPQAADRLLAAAARRGIALAAGKTMMDREAPPALLDDAESGARQSEDLLRRWDRVGRLRYAITVRFAVTSSAAQLAAAGELSRAYPSCIVHSHLSESPGEIEAVRRRFRRAKDYTDVYDRFGLLGPTAVYAHGIHLSARERDRLHETGASVVHCPTSNTFLGSGLFDLAKTTSPPRPVKVGLATDIGGGTRYSMLETMGEAYKVAMLTGTTLEPARAYYLATLGNARCLGLDDEIGSIEAGKWADLVVLDPQATLVLATRHELSESLDDVLFALMMLGDDRAVRATYVAGRRFRPHSLIEQSGLTG